MILLIIGSLCIISTLLLLLVIRIKTERTPERIICAAIRVNGKIIMGHRHHNAIRTAAEIPEFQKLPYGIKLSQDQGFVTSTGRYVNRHDAALIAIKAGQVKNLNPSQELYSEDLY